MKNYLNMMLLLSITITGYGQTPLNVSLSKSGLYSISIDRTTPFLKTIKADSIYTFNSFSNLSIEYEDDAAVVFYDINSGLLETNDTLYLQVIYFHRIDTLTVSSNCPGIKDTIQLVALNQGYQNFESLGKSNLIKINSSYTHFKYYERYIISVSSGNCINKTGYHESRKKQNVYLTNSQL